MIRELNKNILLLNRKGEKATLKDRAVADDLMNTLRFHSDHCVGMAANMIGVNKCIIAVKLGMMELIMYNPVIVSKSGEYETEEGCLCLSGERKTVRYKSITVEYQDADFRKKKEKFEGYVAQIIQHETDHCNGIVI